MDLRDQGLCKIYTILTVDSMSLWSAIAAAVVKVPTEKNLAVHLFWLKELLVTGALSMLRWCDTRDMTADCHTKGCVDRAAILALMRGEFQFAHAVKDYTVKVKQAVSQQQQQQHPSDTSSASASAEACSTSYMTHQYPSCLLYTSPSPRDS